MRAIILAAGRGSRMKHLTRASPKCLLEFRGKALLDWQVDAIRSAGIEEIAIVTGYRRELLLDRGLVEFHNERWAETNMVVSLSKASSWLRETPCLVSYSDIVYGRTAVDSLMRSPGDIAVTYDPNWLNLWEKRFSNPLDDAETFRLTADSQLAEIGGRPSSTNEVEGQYMGLLRFTPRGWGELWRIKRGAPQHDSDQIHMTAILQQVIDAGRVNIAAVPYQDEWGEFDSVGDFTAL